MHCDWAVVGASFAVTRLDADGGVEDKFSSSIDHGPYYDCTLVGRNSFTQNADALVIYDAVALGDERVHVIHYDLRTGVSTVLTAPRAGSGFSESEAQPYPLLSTLAPSASAVSRI